MQTILILGGSGLVGKAIFQELSSFPQFELYLTYHQNKPDSDKRSIQLQLDDESKIEQILEQIQPDIIISCLRGDFSKQLILHEKVVRYLNETSGFLYFFSTTNVFDADFSRSHDEKDIPSSQTDYGQYKLACEKLILEHLPHKSCILRIPQVWGVNSPRFLNLLNALETKQDIITYPNLSYSLTTDHFIAAQLSYLLSKNATGIYHLTSVDIVNYQMFYHDLCQSLGYEMPNFSEDFQEQGYFALHSLYHQNFPPPLNYTSQQIIAHLTK